MRNALQCPLKKAQAMASVAIKAAFDEPINEAADACWRELIGFFEPTHPELAELMTSAEEDVLA